MTDDKKTGRAEEDARDWRTVALALAGVTKTAVDDAAGAAHEAHDRQMKVVTLYADLESMGSDHYVAIKSLESQHHVQMTAMAHEAASEKKRADELEKRLTQVTVERNAIASERDAAIAERDTAIAVQDEAINEQRKAIRRSGQLVAQWDALLDGMTAVAEQTGDPEDKVKLDRLLNQLMENDGLGLQIRSVRSEIHDENKMLRERLHTMEQALDAGTQSMLSRSMERSITEHDGLIAKLQLARGELYDQKAENKKLQGQLNEVKRLLEEAKQERRPQQGKRKDMEEDSEFEQAFHRHSGQSPK
jgi:hypothetical protein